jgi:hypothetical protein
VLVKVEAVLPDWALHSSVAKVGLEGGGTSAKPPDEGVSPEASAALLAVGPTDCAVWRCALPSEFSGWVWRV